MKTALTFCRMPNTVQATPGDHDMFILLGAGGYCRKKLMGVNDVSCFVSSQWLGKMKKICHQPRHYCSQLKIMLPVPLDVRSKKSVVPGTCMNFDSRISALEWHMLPQVKPSPKNWSQSLHISTQRPFRGSCPAPE